MRGKTRVWVVAVGHVWFELGFVARRCETGHHGYRDTEFHVQQMRDESSGEQNRGSDKKKSWRTAVAYRGCGAWIGALPARHGGVPAAGADEGYVQSTQCGYVTGYGDRGVFRMRERVSSRRV